MLRRKVIKQLRGIFCSEEHDTRYPCARDDQVLLSHLEFLKCLVLRTLASKLSTNAFNYLLALHVLINI